MPLRPLSRVPSLLDDFDDAATSTMTVGQMLLPGYSNYARILFPASREDGSLLRWAEVAPGGVTAMSQWWDITQTTVPNGSRDDEISAPPMGLADATTAAALSGLLAAHTVYPSDCYFLVWEGHAGLRPDLSHGASILIGPNKRRMLVLAGSLSDATESVVIGSEHRSPLWWIAADGSWCVGNDVDARSLFIAGNRELVVEVMHTTDLESFVVDPRQVVYPEDN